jgi:vacuolar protein sorting-associated protein 45
MSAATDMDGIRIMRRYIDRIVSGDGKCTGMKVLLLDASTTQILSAVYSQTEILSAQVYLVSRLDDESSAHNGSSTSHMNAVIFCRPTSMEAVGRELAHPRFAEYHIFFSGILQAGQIRALAVADADHVRVRQVVEMFADFLPINSDLWTLQQGRNSLAMTVAAGTSWAPKHAGNYERNLQGLQSLLLAARRQPTCIRYAGSSPCAEELAKDLYDGVQADDVFHFKQRRNASAGGFQVLVLDRRDDPVTPLLSQWTYQAMVHELLGLNNHRVILRGAPNVSKDLEEVVLSSTQDEFFRENQHKNFGELGEEIQRLLKEYQKKAAHHNVNSLNTIEEMQIFMDKFPELRSQSHNVSKHVAIMGELARLVEVCSLMDVSQFEQQLACADDHNTHWRELMEKLESRHIKIPDKLRLGLLYALRYEVSGNMHMVQSAMQKGGVPVEMVNLLPVLLRYGGTKARGPGLFGEDDHIMSKMTKTFMTSVQGVQNVYSQHVPLLMDTLQAMIKGKLSTRTYPVVPGSATVRGVDTLVPEEVLIFMVGGVTYEEGTKIYEFNKSQRAIKVVLAGSTVHNSTSFLDELKATAL